MIVVGLLVVVLVAFLATYALEARHKRRIRRIAETSSDASRVGHNDGMDNPIAAEAVLREGYPPPNAW